MNSANPAMIALGRAQKCPRTVAYTGSPSFFPPYFVHRNSNGIAEMSLSSSPQKASSESGARFPHDAKASMSCKTCRSLGRGCLSLRKRGNQHSEISQTWVCTNPVCAHNSHLSSKIHKRKEGKRASRKCKSCAETGKGEFFCDSDRKVVDLKVELLESKLRNSNQER